MGLDCSHEAWHGSYSSFNRFRKACCRCAGGSYPPHCKYEDNGKLIRDKFDLPVIDMTLDDKFWYIENPELHPGLKIFFDHSDCDGEISPNDCTVVANELEQLLPKMKELYPSPEKIPYSLIDQLHKFIAGCRLAASLNEPLDFH